MANYLPPPRSRLQEQAVECQRIGKGLRHQLKPQFTNTLDFWKHKIVPHPLHMGVGLCYNLLNKLEFDKVISMEQIVEYIKQKYNPLSIIIYGSYANGTNNLNSDFDSLVISCDHEYTHDTSFVNGIQLDVFVYPASYFDGDFDCNNFIQIFDGKIIADSNGQGKTLQSKVLTYLQNRPQKSKAEIDASVDWCIKMLARAKRYDAEGMFRWHWVLIDSLEIFCDVLHRPYWGPKKSLKWMEENNPTAFACYKQALADFSMDSLENWIAYIQKANGAV